MVCSKIVMNKEILIENNSKLEEAITTILSLPESQIWDKENIIIPNIENIDIPAYTNTALTVQGDSNFTAENIKNGVEIWGVTGTMPEGVTGISYGQFTVTNQSSVTVNHGLGVKPKVVMMYPINLNGSEVEMIFHINPYYAPGIMGTNNYGFLIYPGSYPSADFSENGDFSTSTATTITFYEEHSSYPISGTYGWIAIE